MSDKQEKPSHIERRDAVALCVGCDQTKQVAYWYGGREANQPLCKMCAGKELT